MVVLCCRKLPQLWEIFLFIGETNEPVIPIELCMSLSFFLHSFVHIC